MTKNVWHAVFTHAANSVHSRGGGPKYSTISSPSCCRFGCDGVRKQDLQYLCLTGTRKDAACTRLAGDDSYARWSVAGVVFSYHRLVTILTILPTTKTSAVCGTELTYTRTDLCIPSIQPDSIPINQKSPISEDDFWFTIGIGSRDI